MTSSATALTVPLNDSLKLRCPADGKPKPSIKWFKDGKKIHTNEKVTKALHELQSYPSHPHIFANFV